MGTVQQAILGEHRTERGQADSTCGGVEEFAAGVVNRVHGIRFPERGVWGSVPYDEFVQVEDHAGGRYPGGVFRRGDFVHPVPLGQFPGQLRVFPVENPVPLEQLFKSVDLGCRGFPCNAQTERPSQPFGIGFPG